MTTLPLLISLHMPKTAGTSFALALHAHFGARLLEDYADLPMQHGRMQRRGRALLAARNRPACLRGIDCVHGHFLPLKYVLFAGRPLQVVTWMRDPVDRLWSHYRFWQRQPDPDPLVEPLRARMRSEAWPFERFALGPELRDVYCEYLWGFDPGRLAFVGFTESYLSDLARFSSRFLGGVALPARHALAGDENDATPGPALRQRIERWHRRDMALVGRMRDRHAA